MIRRQRILLTMPDLSGCGAEGELCNLAGVLSRERYEVHLLLHRPVFARPASRTIGAPLFGQFGSSARQVRRIVFQLGFEAFHQGKRIGSSAGEADEYAIVHQSADLHCVGFDDCLAQGNLPVAAHGDFAFVTDGEDRG